MKNRKLNFYTNSLLTWALANGFEKSDWDGRRKILCKQLGELKPKPHRIMILPVVFHGDMWRVEIWPPNINSSSLRLFGITEEFVERSVKFLEDWFYQIKKYDNNKRN